MVGSRLIASSYSRLVFKRSTYGEWIVVAPRRNDILRAMVYKLYFLACFFRGMIVSEGSVFVIISGHILRACHLA